MLSPLAKTFVYYVGGSFPVALLCAIPLFDRPPSLDCTWVDRLLRRAYALSAAGVLHPVAAAAAVAVARDVERDADALPIEQRKRQRRALVVAVTSLVVSTSTALLVVALTR